MQRDQFWQIRVHYFRVSKVITLPWNVFYDIDSCGQSYKAASTVEIYESRVVDMSNLLVTTTLES